MSDTLKKILKRAIELNSQQELQGDLAKSTSNMQSYLNNKMIPKASPGLPAPSPAPTPSTLGALAKTSADKAHPGLWANIRAKRARGGKPAKPGSEAYPDKKNWDKLTKKQAGEGSIPDMGAPHHNQQLDIPGTSSPTASHMDMLKEIAKNNANPNVAAQNPYNDGALHALPPPGYHPAPRGEPLPVGPNGEYMINEVTSKPPYNLPAPGPTPAASPTPKLGMYLDALEKISKENVVMHKEDKNPSGGLTQHGRDKYNKATGSHLKAPVTSKNPKGEAKGRKASFCARMSGVKGPMKDEHGKPTRKALALRKWNCN